MTVISGRPISRLTLGTVQLGVAYGAANVTGQPSAAEANRILAAAWDGGITCLDTAAEYGEAEARIGAWMATSGHRPIVISKLPRIPDGANPALFVRQHVDRSARSLGVTC